MFPYSANAIHPRHNPGDQPTQHYPIGPLAQNADQNRDNIIMKNIHAIVAASSLALLASCGRGSAETAKAPTQAEEIAEFCNHMATVAATSSAPPVALMGQIQNKIIEEEWDTDTVVNECAEALRRKAEFMRQRTQAIQQSAQ